MDPLANIRATIRYWYGSVSAGLRGVNYDRPVAEPVLTDGQVHLLLVDLRSRWTPEQWAYYRSLKQGEGA